MAAVGEAGDSLMLTIVSVECAIKLVKRNAWRYSAPATYARSWHKMRFSATYITVFTLLLAGCTVPPKDMKKELNALAAPKPDTMGQTLQEQAEQALAAHDYQRASQMYKQLADKEPAKRDYALALSDSLRRAGDNQSAMQVLDKFLTTSPDDAEALESRGLCLMNLGSFSEAGKSFEKSLAVEPNRWKALNAVGILFSIKGKTSEALAYYDEALRFSDNSASVTNNKAITLAMEGKLKEAIDAFQGVHSRLRMGSDELKRIDMNLALVYAIAGRLDDAERTASPYLSKAALYNNMGVYADLAKNPDLSRGYLNMALTQSPVYYERAWKNLGAVTNETSSPAPNARLISLSGEDADMTHVLGSVKQAAQQENHEQGKEQAADGADVSTNAKELKLDQIPQPDGTLPPKLKAPAKKAAPKKADKVSDAQQKKASAKAVADEHPVNAGEGD